MIHLDTSFVVDLIRERKRGSNGPATLGLLSLSDARLALSLHALCELRAGAELSSNSAAEHRRVDEISRGLQIILPDERLPPIYARLLADLRRRGEPLPTMDLLIASTALADEAELLTANRRHFGRVAGLRLIAY